MIIITALLSVAVIGCCPDNAATGPEMKPSAIEESEQIVSLHKFIIPQKGAIKHDVDAVFGKPEIVKEPSVIGAKYNYPFHMYQLLPPKAGHSSRATLHVTYRNDKVLFININHECVLKGRDNKPEPNEISRENRLVLADLIEIKKKYKSKLKYASWNK